MNKPNPLPGPSSPRLTEDQVAEYLRRHRDFLDRHPELIADLIPARHANGRAVVDLQQYLIEKLRRDLAEMRQTHDTAVVAARGNLHSQQRVHTAVIDLMNAPSFEHFVEAITTDLALKLDVDVVSLCVESTRPNQPRTKSGVRFLPLGAVDALMGPGKEIALRPAVAAERALYGGGATLVKSDALLRLAIGAETPAGIVAVGSREPGHFRAGQGTELLLFLAKTIESTARAWLDLPD
ncbi:MAG: DUF484 family protein [Alphaproteobacteria bacterium]